MSRSMRSKCLAVALVAVGAGTGCHGINPFAADLGSTRIGDRVARAPYMSQFSYFGYIEPTTPPDAQGAGAVYFWLPVSSPELGVRFVSGPVHALRPDAKKDLQETGYLAHRKDAAYFDPAIEVQRCLTALDGVDVGRPCGQWVLLGDNDDSVEMPANPRGLHTNALVRVSTRSEDPLQAVGRGLYRVSFRGAKQTTPKGVFVLQLGAPVLLDAVAMARTPEALAQILSTRTHERLGAAPSESTPIFPEGRGGSLEYPDEGTAPELSPMTPGSM